MKDLGSFIFGFLVALIILFSYDVMARQQDNSFEPEVPDFDLQVKRTLGEIELMPIDLDTVPNLKYIVIRGESKNHILVDFPNCNKDNFSIIYGKSCTIEELIENLE